MSEKLNKFMEQYLEDVVKDINRNVKFKYCQFGALYHCIGIVKDQIKWLKQDPHETLVISDIPRSAFLIDNQIKANILHTTIYMGYHMASRIETYEQFVSVMEPFITGLLITLKDELGFNSSSEDLYGETYLTFIKHPEKGTYFFDEENTAAVGFIAKSNCVKNTPFVKGK